MDLIRRNANYILIIILLVASLGVIFQRDTSREKDTLYNAVERDITSFYAREGYYPKSIEEIEKTYGLEYDHDRYFIGYEVMGNNIRPYVTIVDLEKR
jgi:hypothetical protein